MLTGIALIAGVKNLFGGNGNKPPPEMTAVYLPLALAVAIGLIAFALDRWPSPPPSDDDDWF
ncbi:MAG TPA: hypothetical protein VLL82_12415 [Mycobacterium sp.]|nr:hypothetical protein [Mycobacterium sp.]